MNQLTKERYAEYKALIKKLLARKYINEQDKSLIYLAVQHRLAEFEQGTDHVCEGFDPPDFKCIVCGRRFNELKPKKRAAHSCNSVRLFDESGEFVGALFEDGEFVRS